MIGFKVKKIEEYVDEDRNDFKYVREPLLDVKVTLMSYTGKCLGQGSPTSGL